MNLLSSRSDAGPADLLLASSGRPVPLPPTRGRPCQRLTSSVPLLVRAQLKVTYVPVKCLSSVLSRVTATVNEHAGCAADNTRAVEASETLPARVPPLLFLGSVNVACHVPVNWDVVCVIVKLSVPVPALLSMSVPVQAPVKSASL